MSSKLRPLWITILLIEDWILAISLSQEDGQAALYSADQEATVQSSESVPGSSYEAWEGTSMATPHISRVAALLWSANPKWTNIQIRQAM
jgi:subtilisin family serine protease